MIDSMCQRYSCLPSQVLEEDVALIRTLNILSEAGELNPSSEGGTQPSEPADIESSLANISFRNE